ncbi:LysR family transcriptional regulator [Actinoplanes oblitus]|uniref:LysR family transcriptional regulator n=1 Tax=Actinoplanes oblitus TaxID=3040509 RepID=A0ABY8WU78_9ACTN|nr:LysR family transcriptional regulator [Actinoplanes oblitus]WIM99914.1 LysR family transcriptional regulator [Actinoplanes oblitus]
MVFATGVQVELRDIEIFLALAEELHFGRTAQRLHVSQARVSQSIKTTERRIGAPLFERTSRAVRLTRLGVQLRTQLQPAYRQIVDGIEATATAARGAGRSLTLGTMGATAQTLGDIIEEFRTREPAVEVRFREVHPPDPFTALRSGQIDIGVLWLPVREPDLTVGPVLRITPIMAMMANTHPLARHASIHLEDLGDYTVLAPNGPIPQYMEESLVPFHTPSGRPIPRGTCVSTWQEGLTTVAGSQTMALTQAEAADYYPWPGIVYVPVTDALPSRWALVWRNTSETDLVRSFAKVVAEAGAVAQGGCVVG